MGCPDVWTHSEVGGWKWMPFGEGSQPGRRSPMVVSLGGWPHARANARAKPSTDS